MNQPARRSATYEDLCDLPEYLIGEILNGELHTQPRPAPRHALAASVIGDELVSPFHRGRGGPGGWWILFEPELHLGADILVPDLAGWRRERLPSLPAEAWFDLEPDWVCEILSPGTERVDRVVKLPMYAARGVRWLWLVNPGLRTLEVFELREDRWLLDSALQQDDTVQALPFADHGFSLGDLWAD